MHNDRLSTFIACYQQCTCLCSPFSDFSYTVIHVPVLITFIFGFDLHSQNIIKYLSNVVIFIVHFENGRLNVAFNSYLFIPSCVQCQSLSCHKRTYRTVIILFNAERQEGMYLVSLQPLTVLHSGKKEKSQNRQRNKKELLSIIIKHKVTPSPGSSVGSDARYQSTACYYNLNSSSRLLLFPDVLQKAM